GGSPSGPLIEGSDGMFYGTTFKGASNDFGTVFKINSDGSEYGVLHRFTGADGDGTDPTGGLLEGSDGALYGSCAASNGGTWQVFKLSPDGSGFRVLHRFSDRDRWNSFTR